MRAVKVAAVVATSVWATLKAAQWVMVQALRLAVLGLALYFVGLVLQELLK